MLVRFRSEKLLHPLQLMACIVSERLLQQEVPNEAMCLIDYDVNLSPTTLTEERKRGDMEEERGRRKRGIEEGVV